MSQFVLRSVRDCIFGGVYPVEDFDFQLEGWL